MLGIRYLMSVIVMLVSCSPHVAVYVSHAKKQFGLVSMMSKGVRQTSHPRTQSSPEPLMLQTRLVLRHVGEDSREAGDVRSMYISIPDPRHLIPRAKDKTSLNLSLPLPLLRRYNKPFAEKKTSHA